MKTLATIALLAALAAPALAGEISGTDPDANDCRISSGLVQVGEYNSIARAQEHILICLGNGSTDIRLSPNKGDYRFTVRCYFPDDTVYQAE